MGDVLKTFLAIAVMFIGFFAIFAGIHTLLTKLFKPSRNLSRIAGVLTFLVFSVVLYLLFEVFHLW